MKANEAAPMMPWESGPSPKRKAKEEEAKVAVAQRRLRTWSRAAVVLIMANVALLGYVTYSHSRSLQPEPAPGSWVQAEPAVEMTSEPQPATAAAAPAPPRTAQGSSGPSGSRAPAGGSSARSSYRARGNITDIFCRPFPEETVDEWRARVPAYCTL